MPRAKLDLYETPPHYINALLDVIDIHGRVYEPCAGKGAIADALRKVGAVRSVITNDIDPRREADLCQDARGIHAWPNLYKFDWIVTNPPFLHEQAILTHALHTCSNVAFLARLSFLEPTKDRTAFWAEYRDRLAHLIVLTRYSFRRNDKGQRGSDSQTCCWLVFNDDDAEDLHLTIDGRRADD